MPERGKNIFDALSIRNYRTYWFGFTVLYFASQLLVPAQSWLAFEITRSPLQLTLVAGVQSIPMFLLSIYGGVIIDRMQKRSVIIISQGLTALIALVIAVLITTGHIQYWHLLLSSFLSGITGTFNMIARYAIIAELVPGEKLYNAIALNNAGSNAASIAGPAISGVLMAVIGVQGAYYVGIAFYIAGIIITTLLPATSKLGLVSSDSVLKNFLEGFRYLRLQKTIIIILVMEIALTFFGMCFYGLMPVFADLLKLKSDGYGFMLSFYGIGSLLGSLIVASLGNYKRKGLVLLLSGVIIGVLLVLFANTGNLGNALNLGRDNVYLAYGLLVGAGIFSLTYITTSNTIVQMNTGDEFRGRITSFYSMILGLYPLATLMVGAIAEGTGAPMALTIVASCLTLFMITLSIASRRIRHLT